jgi:hypothetical protein
MTGCGDNVAATTELSHAQTRMELEHDASFNIHYEVVKPNGNTRRLTNSGKGHVEYALKYMSDSGGEVLSTTQISVNDGGYQYMVYQKGSEYYEQVRDSGQWTKGSGTADKPVPIAIGSIKDFAEILGHAEGAGFSSSIENGEELGRNWSVVEFSLGPDYVADQIAKFNQNIAAPGKKISLEDYGRISMKVKVAVNDGYAGKWDIACKFRGGSFGDRDFNAEVVQTGAGTPPDREDLKMYTLPPEARAASAGKLKVPPIPFMGL